MLMKHQPTVSVIIKALNEERHIARAIESALAALEGIDGEVILADGGSTDRTVEIARRYPIVIARLNRTEDRSCGSGAQLGFQYSRGQYLLLIDGDMELHPGFLSPALEVLWQNPLVAGVGGAVFDRGVINEEYEQRSRRRDPDRRVGFVSRLNSSGLYRRTAIAAIGYLTDRNLHGAEELDLGARLHTAGWTLTKIDRPIVDHHPHMGNAYRHLLRRALNKNASATGELLRSAMGQRHFWFVVGKDHNIFLCLLITAWWLLIPLAALRFSGWSAVLAADLVLMFPFLAMSLRWRSVRLGVYSVIAWNVFAFCFWFGLLRPRSPPTDWIDSTVLHDRVLGREDAQAPRGPRPALGSAPGVEAPDAGDLKLAQ